MAIGESMLTPEQKAAVVGLEEIIGYFKYCPNGYVSRDVAYLAFDGEVLVSEWPRVVELVNVLLRKTLDEGDA